MKRTVSIALLEFGKILKKIEFQIGLLMVLIMGGGMVYGAYRYHESFGTNNVIAFYGNFASILTMFLAAKCLGEEFDLKTETFLFTSRTGRSQIILAKIMSLVLANMLIGLCGGILYAVSIVLCKEPWTAGSLLTIVAEEILVYMLYGFAVGAISIMITCLVPNTIMPFIYILILFWVMPGILNLIAARITVFGKIMNYVIFCIAEQFLLYQDWRAVNICVFLFTGVSATITALAIMRKKDL